MRKEHNCFCFAPSDSWSDTCIHNIVSKNFLVDKDQVTLLGLICNQEALSTNDGNYQTLVTANENLWSRSHGQGWWCEIELTNLALIDDGTSDNVAHPKRTCR